MTTSILELGLLGAGLIWLAIGVPATLGVMEPGPGWRDVYVPLTAVMVVSGLTPLVSLVRPTWTRFRIAAHVAVDLAVVVIGALSLAIGNWVVLGDPATATTDLRNLGQGPTTKLPSIRQG